MTQDNLTNKDILQRLLNNDEEGFKIMSRLSESARNIEKHLETLNSKVAANVKEIEDLKTNQRTLTQRVGIYVSIVTFVISIAVNKYLL